jgi:hypothetical protein
MMANIKINLARPSTIKAAINKVRKMADTTIDLNNRIVVETTERLVAKVKARADAIGHAGYPRKMSETIHAEYPIGANGCVIGLIYGADWIIYVEYGTGTVGGAESPSKPDGWYYFNEELGHVVFTTGMKAQPFLRTAFEEELAVFPANVKARFSEWTRMT